MNPFTKPLRAGTGSVAPASTQGGGVVDLHRIEWAEASSPGAQTAPRL
ncbi:hypothetical protein [Xylella fastidiosa]